MSTLNLTLELEQLIGDVVRKEETFSHIDPARVMVCVATTRGGGVHGTYAKIHPLRFSDGARNARIRRGSKSCHYEMPTVTRKGVEILYVIYFLVPRFLNLTQHEKLVTLFHELYHISPECNGDIRRFPGKNYAHGSSRKKFNALIAKLVDSYLEKLAEPATLEFLDGDLATLRSRYSSLVGRRMAAPKLRIIKEHHD